MGDNIHPQPVTWTPEKIRRFWNYTSQKKNAASEYFSYLVGEALVHLLQRANALRSGSKILDFGCGPGFLLEKMLESGSDCHGFDFSDAAVANVNERFRSIANWRGAISSTTLPAPFDDESFELITCVETLEHLLDSMISSTLVEIRRLLKKDGVVLFTTPHDEDLEKSHVYCPDCARTFHPVQHIRSFTKESLGDLLEKHGFTVIYCENIDLLELQRFKYPGRLTIRGSIRYCWNLIQDFLNPISAKGTSYHLPRVTAGSNLCAIAQKQER